MEENRDELPDRYLWFTPWAWDRPVQVAGIIWLLMGSSVAWIWAAAFGVFSELGHFFF